jgi:predicted nucleic acid-binding protein
MKLGKLVVNSSPIISLAKIGHADLLLELSSKLIIPEGVYQEIVNHKNSDSAVEWIKSQDSSLIRTVGVPLIISEWNLGKGESQVISFAYQNMQFAAVLDDRAARRCSELFNIKVFGTISIIIKAKINGTIPEAKPLLLKLQSNGFRISEDIILTALKIVGENK